MTVRPPARTGPVRRALAPAALLLGLAAAAVAVPDAAHAAPGPAASGVVVPLAAGDQGRVGGDDGRRTFGVQPSGPKKVDARPNLTYRDVAPGQRFFDHVAFLNVSEKPVTLTVYPADAVNTPDGGFDALRAGQPSTQLGSWIRMRRTQVRVPARSAFITPIEVRVPRDAEPGDHAAAILASLRSTTRDAEGNVVNRDDRVGTRVYLRVKGTLTPRIELRRHDASFAGGLVRGRADVTYTVTNTGNVRLEGTQSVRVGGLFGLAARAVDIPAMPELLPGNEFTFTAPVDDVLPTFYNVARVTIDPTSVTGNVDPALAQVTAETSFLAVSWAVVALLALAVLTGVLLWAARRRRGPAGGRGGRPGRGGRAGGGDVPWDPPPAVPARPRPDVMARRGLVVAGLVLAAVLAPAGAARAADGTLTFVPGRATVGTPIYAVTSAGCPQRATNVLGRVFGKGMPADGRVVVPNQDAPVRSDGPFGVALQDNMRNVAREEGIERLEGPYRVELQCIDQFGTQVHATFTGTLTFDVPTEFTAPVPQEPPVGGVPDGYLALVFPEYREVVRAQAADRVQEIAGGGEGPVAAAPSASVAAPSGAGLPASAATGGPDPAGPAPAAPLLVGLAAAAVVAGALWLWSRPRAAPPVPRAADRSAPLWPDDDPAPTRR